MRASTRVMRPRSMTASPPTSTSPAVVTQRIKVHPYLSAHEKLDVELTIAAYEKAKPADKPKAGAAGGDTTKSGT